MAMKTVVLFDGECPYCISKVQWLHSRDKKGAILFATLRSRFAESIGVSEADETIKVVRMTPGGAAEVLERSTAVLETLRGLGGAYSAVAALGSLVPRFLRDAVYRFIATRRHRIPAETAPPESALPAVLINDLTVSELAAASSESC